MQYMRFKKRMPLRNEKISVRQLLALASVVILLTAAVSTTLAYIVAESEGVVNVFTPSEVSCEVLNTTSEDGTEQSGIYVENTGDTEAYIRAALIVTWSDGETVYGAAPTADYYTLTLNTGNTEADDGTWIKEGNYYYFNKPVAAGESTASLIEEIVLIGKPAGLPDGYELNVEVVASAVQSTPADAFIDAWGESVYTAVIGVAAEESEAPAEADAN